MIIRVAKIEKYKSDKHRFYVFIDGVEFDVGLQFCEEDAISEAFKLKRKDYALCV